MSEHAVIISFKLGEENYEKLHSLADELAEAIEAANVGEYDGYEFTEDLSDGTLYIYGPDADALLAVILPVLRSNTIMSRANALLRYGAADDLDARERRITI